MPHARQDDASRDVAQAIRPHAGDPRDARVAGRASPSPSSPATLGVSPATIRRDLADLEDQGLLVRTHGGARAFSSASRAELPVRLRDSQFREAKQRIARRAAELIPAGPYSVALSGGTTTAEVAKVLATRRTSPS